MWVSVAIALLLPVRTPCFLEVILAQMSSVMMEISIPQMAAVTLVMWNWDGLYSQSIMLVAHYRWC